MTPAEQAAAAAAAAKTAPEPFLQTTIDGEAISIPDKESAARLVAKGLSVEARERAIAAREQQVGQFEAVINDFRSLQGDPERAEAVRRLVAREDNPRQAQPASGGALPEGEAANPQIDQLQRELAKLQHQVRSNSAVENRERLQREVREAVNELPQFKDDANARALAEEIVLANKLARPGVSAQQLAFVAATKLSALKGRATTEELTARRAAAEIAPIAPGDGSPGLSGSPASEIVADRTTRKSGGLKAALKSEARALGITGAKSVLSKPF